MGEHVAAFVRECPECILNTSKYRGAIRQPGTDNIMSGDNSFVATTQLIPKDSVVILQNDLKSECDSFESSSENGLDEQVIHSTSLTDPIHDTLGGLDMTPQQVYQLHFIVNNEQNVPPQLTVHDTHLHVANSPSIREDLSTNVSGRTEITSHLNSVDVHNNSKEGCNKGSASS